MNPLVSPPAPAFPPSFARRRAGVKWDEIERRDDLIFIDASNSGFGRIFRRAQRIELQRRNLDVEYLDLCTLPIDCGGGKSFKYAALGNRAMTALPDQRFQLFAQRRKVGQLPLHLDQMFVRYGVHGFAGLLIMVGQIEQGSNLLNGKAKIASASCEDKTADVLD